jgi:hypothetical protein
MSAASLSGASLASAHEQFLAVLPAMKNVIVFRFRALPKRHRAKALNHAIAECWLAWSGLTRRGKMLCERGVGDS